MSNDASQGLSPGISRRGLVRAGFGAIAAPAVLRIIPANGFTWTYQFCWRLEDVIGALLALWDSAPTNKIVGGLFPNDADGNAWGDPQRGLPPALAKAGYRLTDPGRYQLMNNDFTSQI